MICKYFLPFLSTLWIESFDAQNFVSFIKSNSSVFLFCYFCLWCHSQKLIAKCNVLKLFLYFILLSLTSMLLIHLGLIFVYSISYIVFHPFMCHYVIFAAPFVEKIVFPYWMVLASLWKIICVCEGLFLNSASFYWSICLSSCR